ncbi:GNAT family N-acetyltransferase [Mesorhizobium sp. RP14(2022)]|uniref:GNAT family N-acetyltransferase n=1 Tax=Mesorhizobium liriopis TaxID=2953882 RepID=A0ABT1C1Z0_9HYPH|nr:GNAT family N-acetyltransferase [Mesorhizobium liriopis]MCO6048837.1 GNAT family N-acetyltransferase [Mesorhizobium liriopis]
MTQIRSARPDDIPAITEIYRDAVLHGTATYELEPPTAWEMMRRFEALAVSKHPYLVAEDQGRVLAYAYAGPFRPRPAYRFTVEDSIYVAPDSKGRGLGKLLLERLIEACERRGYRQILAVIGDGHEKSPSVILHARLGFKPSGVIEGSGFKHGRWLDTAIMQRALNGGKTTLPD